MTNIRRGTPAGAGEPEGGRATDGRGELSTYPDDIIAPMSCQIYAAGESLHAAGLCVIPLRERSKEPALSEWTPYQSRRPDASERWEWWGERPERNIAVVCGAVSGNGAGKSLAVLDFDDPAAFDAFAAEHPEIVSTTWTARTGGGGTHVYLRIAGDVPTDKIVGGDLKAEGSYVVAPPSTHPNGQPYQWYHRAATILEIESLAALGIEPKARKGPAPAVEGKIRQGERNTTLTSLAGTMRRRGISEAAILEALLVENETRCNPPLDRAEVGGIARSVAKYEPAKPGSVTIGHNLTDLGNAERLVARHGADLRYCHPWARWLVWDGRRWAIDDTAEVRRRAKETVRAIYAEAAQLADETQRKARARWAIGSENRTRLEAMIALAQSEWGIPVLPDDLDADHWLLTVNNGTLDLRTGGLRPHDPGGMITHLVPVDYDPNAQAPLWMRFLHRVMDKNDDLIAFLRRAVGYSLTGDTGERVLFFLHGCGANGKSTFLETIRAVAGDYGLRTPTETLLTKRDGTIPNDVARLKGARLVTAAEAEEGKRLAEALVKDITGGDTISARFLRAEWFDFRPQCKIWLAANHKPTVRGTDRAIWDRIKLIPFTVTIPEDEQDKSLGEKLRVELPGILAWAVRGCLEWQEKGLGIPDEVKVATNSYREEMDILGGFIADCCELGPTVQETTKGLYQGYADWCEANGERPISKIAFGMRLAERGFDQYRTGKTRGWMGIQLLTPGAKDDFVTPYDTHDTL